MAPRARQHLGLVSAGLLAAALAFGASPASAQDSQARIDGLMRNAVAQHGLRAAIVQVKVGGRTVITRAYGESVPGTPATTRMRFRAGTVATAHMSTLLLRLAQQGKVRLGDKLSKNGCRAFAARSA
jgi:CubicO group peptidase (beta-lactamase class C family)